MDEAGFEIGGERYSVPPLDSFDLDEAEILYEVSGFLLEDLEPAHPEWTAEDKRKHVDELLRKIGNPKFKKALAHIAYRRRHPDVTFELGQQAAGKVNSLEITIAFIRGDAEDPSTSQKPQGSSESSSEPSKPEDSGSPSVSGSGAPVSQLATTGAGR